MSTIGLRRSGATNTSLVNYEHGMATRHCELFRPCGPSSWRSTTCSFGLLSESRLLSHSAMSLGRIHCVLFANKGTNDVIYERFYDRLNELEKAEIRAAFALAASNVRLNIDDQDHVGTHKSARFTFIPYGDVVVYLLGSGEYDELACASIIRTIVAILQDVLDKAPSTSLLMEKYMKVVVILDEMINEGILESTDKDAIRKALKNKATWE